MKKFLITVLAAIVAICACAMFTACKEEEAAEEEASFAGTYKLVSVELTISEGSFLGEFKHDAGVDGITEDALVFTLSEDGAVSVSKNGEDVQLGSMPDAGTWETVDDKITLTLTNDKEEWVLEGKAVGDNLEFTYFQQDGSFSVSVTLIVTKK